MSKKNKAYNLIILDESGSMESIKDATISGFNELIQSIQSEADKDPEMEQFIQFFSFNSDSIRELVPLQLMKPMQPLTVATYVPAAMTPLFDAIGYATSKLRYALEKEKDYVVLVTILTDGAENASKEYTRQTIANIIKQLEEQDWVFTYMGTNQDVMAESMKISVSNYMSFNYNPAGMKAAMNKEQSSRSRFYKDAKEGKMDEVKRKYYRPEEE